MPQDPYYIDLHLRELCYADHSAGRCQNVGSSLRIRRLFQEMTRAPTFQDRPSAEAVLIFHVTQTNLRIMGIEPPRERRGSARRIGMGDADEHDAR